jgi:hypothetical protein
MRPKQSPACKCKMPYVQNFHCNGGRVCILDVEPDPGCLAIQHSIVFIRRPISKSKKSRIKRHMLFIVRVFCRQGLNEVATVGFEAPCCLFCLLFHSEDRHSTLFRDAGELVPVYMASHTLRSCERSWIYVHICTTFIAPKPMKPFILEVVASVV